MKVQYSEIRTPCEELDHLKEQYLLSGNFFSWEVHPNVLRASDMYSEKLRKKIRTFTDSASYKEYTGS